MPIYTTDDITNDMIIRDLDLANRLYTNIIAQTFTIQDEEVKRKIQGQVRACCSQEDLNILVPCVRLFIANFQTPYGERMPAGYAAAAILYLYYHLALIETGINSFLEVRQLRFVNLNPDQIRRLIYLTNFLITSDEPYVKEIRRKMLAFDRAPFLGGKKNRRKTRINLRKHRKTKRHNS